MNGFPQGVQALASALASGALSAVEAAEYYLSRIAERDAALNSFIAVSAQAAREQAAAADARRARGEAGPLNGIPLAVKDNIDVAGVVTTAGIGAYRDRIARSDAAVIESLRAAGAVILGKTNLHEAALGSTTDNPHFGACHNPHRHGYTPGGSSGGSAAAVAAGLCAAALGTDTLGSVRIPAAYCGCVGFKPSPGIVSARGVVPLSWTLDHVGPLTPRVADLWPLMHVLARFDAAYAHTRPPPVFTEFAEPRAELRGLRIGVVADLADRVELAPAVEQAFAEALRDLRALGARLRDIALPDYDFSGMRRLGLLITEAEASVVHAAGLETDPGGYSETLRAMLDWGAGQSAARLAAAYRQHWQTVVAARALFAEVDLIALPTTPQAAFSFDRPAPDSQADLTGFANLARCPALSLPMGDDDGLPLGLQLIAPEFHDQRALLAGTAFERRTGRFSPG